MHFQSAITCASKEESDLQQDLQENHDTTVFLCRTLDNVNSSKRRLADNPSNVKRNSTRKDARVEDRSVPLATITMASDDDDVDSADYSNATMRMRGATIE